MPATVATTLDRRRPTVLLTVAQTAVAMTRLRSSDPPIPSPEGPLIWQ
jgi:hypothetical protein